MKKLRYHVVNALLYVFGTTFVKKVRSIVYFWKNNIKQRSNDSKFVENNMHLFDELIVKAESLGRMDYKTALEESAEILKN